MRTTLGVVLAVVLAATLAFLYYKTEAVDFKRHSSILANLRELKDIDGRWDAELFRSHGEFGRGFAPSSNVAQALERALTGLVADAPASASMSSNLEPLKAAFAEKAGLMEKHRAASASVRDSLVGAVTGIAEIQSMARGARLANVGGGGDRLASLDVHLAELQSQLLRFNLAPDTTTRSRLEAATVPLRQGEARFPDVLAASIGKLIGQTDSFMKTRPQEQELFSRLSLLTAGPRVDTVTNAVHRELESRLQEKEIFRVYLIAYTGSLLILLAHVGSRLRQSYKLVADANAALKRANQGLEKRVAERTRELSDTLKTLKESESMLVQSEKMSSLGQMVAGVVHEINTPLAYVKNTIESVDGQMPGLVAFVDDAEKLLRMLQEGTATEQALGDQFTRVSTHVARLRQDEVGTELPKLVKDGKFGIGQISEIVANLKDFSRLDRNRIDRFDVHEGLESTLMIARHLVKSVSVKKAFGTLPKITASPSQLNQVFLNLVTNAVQAMEEGRGELTITTRAPDPKRVEIEIADNGKGIPADVLPKIFDPFFTTKPVGQGTGLGLSISYKIVQAHGGRIEVQSQPGSGTRFTVTLPVTPPAEAPKDA
jgi:signal transduction histidine kinase